MSYKGINYGKVSLDGNTLGLSTVQSSAPLLNIRYEAISNSIMNKNDIIIETAFEEVGNDDCMCEIRFHVEEPKEDNNMDIEKEEEGN
jgi:hypothetical protein